MIELANISFDKCIKCTVCTIYCPVARNTPLFAGPKASGPDGERLRIKSPWLVEEGLKYCSNCKRCETVCPSSVKVADMIQSARRRALAGRFRPRDFLLSRTDLLGGVASRVSGLVNFVGRLAPARWVLSLLGGLDPAARLPRYGRGLFRAWFAKKAPDQSGFDEQVIYFHGCWVNYNDHGLGRDVVFVLNRLGLGVRLVEEVCCGIPLTANGYLDKARDNAVHNLAVLGRGLEQGAGLVTASSSTCLMGLAHEYPNLLDLDISVMAGRLKFITQLASERLAGGRGPKLARLDLHAAYHAPCHLKFMGGVRHTLALLKSIPGLRLTILNSECCGLAGTYGFKRETGSLAREVGRALMNQIDSLDPDLVITDCETCKLAIESATKRTTLHPASLLALALGRGAEVARAIDGKKA